MKVRVTLDFEAGDDSLAFSPTRGATTSPIAALQLYLDAMVKHQDLGSTLGVRDLARLGFAAPRLVAAATVGTDS